MTKQDLEDWAFARVELGISAAEWLDLTPLEWTALNEAWKQKQKREMQQAAAMKAHLANLLSSREDGRPWTVGDFMPQPAPEISGPDEADRIMKGFRRAFD